ncbi:UDP-3-O-(3-hydroxymyristoyl)glucosamine N-acyltransferase [Mesorhizobium sp. M1C.F.Ca.ET.193.01.1.1]|uniref:UDP-3-O-(3-hydroxymyristoyl)glucosamine N-acyltransferase n=1 Tax=unclassified Mesorhizobium TaxID=325217 RepID=UPI000FD58D22|nr:MULTISPECIES: UDP-3-O-(3-hydroxymyristoyl)glucosamine N-acyltransferase [unclassified Mesorhizobium]TGT03509.1 UDP-3-O-(3-hydroxymyristoyl)glucosamine N-acyltransferase [bacterium M00.F.Ca.ET.177.01.1.1]TGQ56193.1 UDP-3-O-(3-hydroxymyristoyl)glucosamine N-acyltransferase [Mesorhizobium sp. M1C.F.Ca.ET.210.01.1.1]TGQ75278.1 UDP-3-O-(3-hydroxymyristoyl)glucosamine N-acyltransferase [Mesorhizobium sp. M1C.F.Ca.ET.212.01.1.1]TGR13690.1 UDP-3-O-(3-hydroxymyristoyl)glucosamine N-acyltransferase [M
MTDPVFFAPSRRYTAGEVANLTGANLVDTSQADVAIEALAPANEGGDSALVFVDGKRNFALMQSLKAAAVLCPADFASRAPQGIAVLVHPRPQQAFAMVGRLLFPQAATPGPMTGETGISPQAHIDASAHVETGAIVEAGAVIGPDASIGAGTVIAPHAIISRSCKIGRDGYVGPGASIQYALIGNRVIIHGGARIGQDGFGFVGGAKGPERVPQIGRVIIQDDVEIGSNSTVDRGAMSDTIIGQGTKIDNLVQIAHNVRIGRNCIIAGLSGISGSVVVGDNVTMGGGVGLADHLTIGPGAKLAARSGFMSNVPAGEVWGGYPAQPMAEAMREIAMLRRLARTRKQSDGNG